MANIPSTWRADFRTRRWFYTGDGRWQFARRMTREEFVALRDELKAKKQRDNAARNNRTPHSEKDPQNG